MTVKGAVKAVRGGPFEEAVKEAVQGAVKEAVNGVRGKVFCAVIFWNR